MPGMLQFLQIFAWTWFGAVYFVRLLGLVMHTWRARICLQDGVGTINRNEPEGVTILRPIKGVNDSDLYECLKSTFVQTYKPIQILMCVSDPEDPAIAIAEKLINEFPNIDAGILKGPDQHFGINPKVNNLVKGYQSATYDIIWTLDSNVMMHPNSLSRAIPLCASPVQLVHHLPLALAKPGAGWGGLLDETYMLTAHSTFYTGINTVGIAPCVTGKSNLYRRSDLDRASGAPPGCGLEHFAGYMAEDQMISEALWKQGGRTAIAPDAAIQPLGEHIDLQEFLKRRARWIRLRKYMVTSATLVEPFTDCFVHTLFIALVANMSLKGVAFLFLVYFTIDWLNYRVLFSYIAHEPRPLFNFMLSWLVREILAFPLWLWAMGGRRIQWRNKYYQIKRDLTAEASY